MENPDLKNLSFGLFDDSFMHEDHGDYNTECWNFFDRQRYQDAPAGGEFSYYTDYDQEHVLDPQGPYGTPYEEFSSEFHITCMIGNDQPEYQSMTRIKESGMANGYKYRITQFLSMADSSIVTVENFGVAPIYYDAFIAVDGVRAGESLAGLQPQESMTFGVSAGGDAPELTIECDRLVDGQKIEFEADLEETAGIADIPAVNLFKGILCDELAVYSLTGQLLLLKYYSDNTTLECRLFNSLPQGFFCAVLRNRGVETAFFTIVRNGNNIFINPAEGGGTPRY